MTRQGTFGGQQMLVFSEDHPTLNFKSFYATLINNQKCEMQLWNGSDDAASVAIVLGAPYGVQKQRHGSTVIFVLPHVFVKKSSSLFNEVNMVEALSGRYGLESRGST
ncbi:hypothetical protein RJ641_028169 [Dillenia turbinata]|uniref:Uncharacterized protein n=1 Tax=Dillenia turbinata TaxID=194707 RepID=A0AAN8WBF8_9MAGN